MATPADVISLLQTYDSIGQTELQQALSIISQIQAIDPSASDATSQLTALQQQYQVLKNDPSRAAAYQAYSNAYDSLSSSDQAIVNNDPSAAVNKSLVAQGTSGIYASTVASVQAAIANANSVPPAGGNTQQMSGTVNDDSADAATNPTGAPQQPNNPAPPASGGSSSVPQNPNASTPVTNTNGTNSVVQTSKKTVANSTPGRRLKNPLGYLSSYTYQITLYMITPDAYDAFVTSGRTNINILNGSNISPTGAGTGPGAFIIAQSGGVNNKDSQRAAGFQYDYYIDNLSIKQAISGKQTKSATNESTINFTITEPYGFSFITRLRTASDAIEKYSTSIGKSNPQNPTKQIFILGIRFLGYDSSGNLIKPTEVFDGSPLDPNSSNGTLFETFHDIGITAVKTKLDGRVVQYAVEAAALSPGAAYSTKRGLIPYNITVTGTTVDDLISDLFTKLNTISSSQKKQNPPISKLANTYTVTFNPGTSLIYNASIFSQADLDKSKTPTSSAKTTEESNAATEMRAITNTKARSITFNNDQTILGAINQIIAQSTYLSDALNAIYASVPEADPKKGGQPTVTSTGKAEINWYNCSPEISNPVWDDSIKDWTYNINYIISIYKTPVIETPYAKGGPSYYGPHKRYDYWYTGKNSEIISYEQNMNNLYFNYVIAGASDSNSAGSGGSNTGNAQPGTSTTANKSSPTTSSQQDIALAPNQKTNQPTTGKIGDGMEAQNSYITNLYDPTAYADMSMTIFGDPDYLMSVTESSVNTVYDQFYGPGGFIINPNGGQVFIEIDFKEAVDYSSNGVNIMPANSTNGQGIAGNPGTLSINDSILFFKYPQNVNVKGISYMLTDVTSTFSNGSFKQKLEGIVNTMQDSEPTNTGNSRPSTSSTGTASGPSTNPTKSSTNSGTVTDPPVNNAKPQQNPPNTATNTPTQSTTSKGVANDDGVATSSSANPMGTPPGSNYVWNSTTSSWVSMSSNSNKN
jgi:hypothetical protein